MIAKYFSYKDIYNEAAKKEKDARLISEDESAKLKKCLLDMAADLDDRCRKLGIDLFLVGGTLLGAVRHQGFIPWDDDMDLGVSREHYEKIKELFEEHFSDQYEYRCPNSPYPNGTRFMQIFKKGTVLKTLGGDNPFRPQSVFIDIFPYDYVPENPLIRKIKGLKANMLMFVSACVMDEKYMSEKTKSLLESSRYSSLYLKMRLLTGKLFSWRKPEKWFDCVDKAIQNEKTSLLTSATGRNHYFGEIYATDVFFPLQQMKFEDHVFGVPGKWEEYLKGNYGNDYMTPPSVEKRESHYVIEISL